MKKNNIYILGVLSLVLSFTACDKIEPEFFDGNYNGAYFGYDNSDDFQYNLNFSDHTSGMPDEVIVPVNIKLLGYLKEEKRTVSIKTREIKGYELPEITIPEVFFENKEHEKIIEVKVKRPTVENEEYAVCLYLDGEGDLGSGIAGKEEFFIYVTEKYEQPELWAGVLETNYLGQWNKDKQIFITNLTGDNDFLKKLYSRITTDSKVIDYEAATKQNATIFNSFFTEERNEPVTFNFPILSTQDNPQYNEPYFWDKYSEYQCKYTTDRFFALNSLFGKVLNTANIEEAYIGENDIKKVKDKRKEFHVEDVLEMLKNYYLYASLGYPIQEYKDSCWTEMFNKNINAYEVVQPYWWEDPDSTGAAQIVKDYFGDYSIDKYKFMIQAMISNEGSQNFVAAKMFPFVRNLETNGYEWDSSVGGEDYMKNCYTIIKDRYDNNTSDKIKEKFNFPEKKFE